MRKDAALERRLADVAALQALRASASHAELIEAQAGRVAAANTLVARDDALDAGMREMDALLASDVLDFQRWRIGRAVLEELGNARHVAAEAMTSREDEEAQAQAAFGIERARRDRADTLHRAVARHLDEKRDDAATLEANALTAVRKRMGAG